MRRYGKTLALAAATLAGLSLVVTGCGSSDADIAASNLSKAAEQFEIPRRIVFINGITDKYLFAIEGRCSVETAGSALSGALEVTCLTGLSKTGKKLFKKHFLGLSDNISFMVQQVEGAEVSTTHYRVIFKPEALLPDFDRP